MEARAWQVGLQQQHAYQHGDMMDIGTCRNILVHLLKLFTTLSGVLGAKYDDFLWNLGLCGILHSASHFWAR